MKSFPYLFFCAISTISLSAQSQPIQLWQSVEYVKSINIEGPSIAIDKFQNTYMLTNQIDERPLGGFTLVKYDTLGNLLWKQNSTASFSGIIYGNFSVDSTGNVYVGEIYDGGLPNYDADAILVKYKPSGVKQWAANYGLNQSGDSYIYYSQIDTLNGRLITLGMNLHDTIPDENFLFVQAVDTADGNVIWKTKIKGVFRPQNLRIQSDHIQLLSTRYQPDSMYFVNTLVDFEGNVVSQYEKPYSGYDIDFNYISKTGDVIFGNRAFGYNVTRVNLQGDTLWTYIDPLNSGTNRSWVRSIVEDSLFNIYATGTLDIPGQNVEMTTSKINISGELIWQDIFQSSNGNFSDGGENVSLFERKLITAGATQFGNADVVGIIKLYDIEDGDLAYDILITNENLFVIDEAFMLGNKLFYTGEGYQSNINNMVAVTGCFLMPKVSTLAKGPGYSGAIKSFPNPTTDFVQVSQLDTYVFYEIAVYDSSGKKILTKKIEASEERINLSGFPSGQYTVYISGKNARVAKQIIKI